MRASRLLQMLLLLQNRGRQTCAQLAHELEVTRRTVLRDVEALTSAGLPVVVLRGPKGGIELGFNYRTRLTGLTPVEAEALSIILMQPVPALEALGLADAGRVARAKLIESFPDGVRENVAKARAWYRVEVPRRPKGADERVAALAQAIRERRRVRIRARSDTPRTIHPAALIARSDGWSVVDALAPAAPIALERCGDINISALRY